MNQGKLRFLAQASIAAFGAYFCMYAFRKPFSVATFEGLSYFGIDYKILLIIAQVIGYTLSKFLGIKIIAEMPKTRRLLLLVSFIVFAELALLGFAVVHPPYNILFLFLNGLPLGMIWGIVFSYLEGRKTSEVLGVILCSSFIVSSGAVKSVGKYLMDVHSISAFWMPFFTGLLFLLPLLFFAFLLEKLPSPSQNDILKKSLRKPLNKTERIQLFRKFAFPLTILVIFYTALTAIRDFRDNFARELWDSLGYEDSSSIYSVSEIPIAIVVLAILGVIGSVANNKRAFNYYHYILIFGCLTVITATFLFQTGSLPPLFWMILSGFGMYICYVPFNGLYFDRMIATFKIKGNVGYLIYIADAFGYLGSIAILLYKNFGQAQLSWLNFFIYSIYFLGAIGIMISITALFFFNKKYQKVKEIDLKIISE